MRIAGGAYKGRALTVPKSGVRPTSDKVRQAMFNMLHARGAVDGAIVLDAFCGSGALGLEALSQGAAHITFWDKSADSLKITKENAGKMDAQKCCAINRCDITKLSEKPQQKEGFTLVFLDPPYNENLIPLALEKLISGGWLAPDCLIVMEMAKNENPPLPEIDVFQEKIYGDTKVVLAYSQPA